MSRPRNYVSELKDKAKVLRSQQGAPDDFSGFLFTGTESQFVTCQFEGGYLAGVIVMPYEDMDSFAERLLEISRGRGND